MGALTEVTVPAVSPERLESLLGSERITRFIDTARALSDSIDGATIWNVNSTASGGGVAEMLRCLLPLARGAGIDSRWLVIQGNRPFFAVTKRLHNRIYGLRGDEGLLGDAERTIYESTLGPIASELPGVVRPRDIVILHDPQTAGLASAARAAGARVIWRCHIGSETSTALTAGAWAFLEPFLRDVRRIAVSSQEFCPPGAAERIVVIPPSIDPLSPKNQPMTASMVHDILRHCGLESGAAGSTFPGFVRADGSPGRVNRFADVLQSGPPLPADAPLVVQISRWDRAKDMSGVMTSFAEHLVPSSPAHLILAGPTASGVADDPEASDELSHCFGAWQRLTAHERSRIHLACLPMHDVDENAAIVNALQRRAAVVTQKSLAEGFGLTVAEAMWKERAVIASAVGGMKDQIIDGVSGILLDDPYDLDAFGLAMSRLMSDESLRDQLGKAAAERVRDLYLEDIHLERWASVIAQVTAD